MTFDRSLIKRAESRLRPRRPPFSAPRPERARPTWSEARDVPRRGPRGGRARVLGPEGATPLTCCATTCPRTHPRQECCNQPGRQRPAPIRQPHSPSHHCPPGAFGAALTFFDLQPPRIVFLRSPRKDQMSQGRLNFRRCGRRGVLPAPRTPSGRHTPARTTAGALRTRIPPTHPQRSLERPLRALPAPLHAAGARF